MTIQDASKQLIAQLATIYDSGEATAISDWVMEHVTGAAKSDRISARDKSLDTAQQQEIKDITVRLLNHEPVQYVLNECWFCGLKFYVDKHVLIPRPETEELVEWVIANCKFPVDKLTILDIGSGSGCIPVALKRKLRKANVWGCDASESALQVAGRNATRLNADVRFVLADFLDKQQRDQLPLCDIITSNPPYVPEKDKEQMQSNVLNYEPHMALFVPDNDALVFYKAIAEFGITHLNKGGIIYTEIHESLGKEVTAVFAAHGFKTDLKKDMQGKDRMIKAYR